MSDAKPIVYLSDLLGYIQNLDKDTIITLDGTPRHEPVVNGPSIGQINLTALMDLLERDKLKAQSRSG